ncbi:MAG: transporter-related protein [Candidatus Parcubacteria bacterium]|nr:transporter-related protein [Candidatus Parcubacteria bacterium]
MFQRAGAYKNLFIPVLSLSVLYSIIDPLDTFFFGRFIDALSHDKTFVIGGYVIPSFIGLICLWLIFQLIEVSIHRYRVLYGLKLSELVRTSYISDVMGHIFRLPISFHKTVKQGEVQERLSSAAGSMQSLLSDDLTSVCPAMLSIVIALGFICSLNAYLFLFVIGVLVLFLYVTFTTARPLASLQRKSQKIYAKARGIASDAATNIRIVKDFTAEAYQTEAIRAKYQQEAMPIWFKLMSLRRQQTFIQQCIIIGSRFIVFVASIFFVKSGAWTIGDLVIANGYMSLIFSPIRDLSNNWRNIQNGIIAIEDVQEVLDMPTESYVPAGPIAMDGLKGGVAFDNVSFGYDKNHPILHAISFNAKPGDIIALVGESGVGKSSLIDLIVGYHFPLEGEILIDGQDIRKIPLAMLRGNIATVTQEVTLFNDTITNNLRYGNFDKTREEIMAAARKAHCFDFIERFPEKWDQIVGERGMKLSVGQKQRVAIARAILKDPKILILDEPTSALDASSEKIITDSLDELMRGKTTFVVAHRLSTVRRADTILVFKEGRIVESGTHTELLAKESGEYKRLYDLQIGLHE